MSNPAIQQAAWNLRTAIESSNGPAIQPHLEALKSMLGGYAPLQPMTPEGVLLYLVALILSQPEGTL